MTDRLKIGQEVLIHGYVDEIRKDVVIVRNEGGYFGTVPSEIKPSAEPKIGHWIDDKCSACGKGIEDLIDSSEWYQNENPKYCPFCGIKIQPYKAEKEIENE